MKWRASITWKIAAAFVALALLEAALGAYLIRRSTRRELERFLQEEAIQSFAAVCRSHFDRRGSWDGVMAAVAREIGEPRRPAPPPGAPSTPRDGRRPPPPPPVAPVAPFALADEQGRIVVPSADYRLGSIARADDLDRGLALTADGGGKIGTVLRSETPRFGPTELRYLERVDWALATALLVAVGVSLGLGLLATRAYAAPLRELTAAARAMTKGELYQKVPVRSNDELGQLTEAFNRMSADLAAAAELRQRMTADIAHNLRTPLSVITGYLEAMAEGKLEPSAERLETVRAEAERLRALVDDLRLLSLADSGDLPLRVEPLDPRELVASCAAAQRQVAATKSVELLERCDASRHVVVDPEQMTRVLANLIENAIRHTPPGGRVAISASDSSFGVALRVSDTGPGIGPSDVAHVFDRFYRGDDARDATGGANSGLGLAIAKSIVDLHDGRLSVEETSPHGTTFLAELPARPRPRG